MLKTQIELLAIISDDLKGPHGDAGKPAIESIGEEETIAEVPSRPSMSSMDM
jgi:hypothetical protein